MMKDILFTVFYSQEKRFQQGCFCTVKRRQCNSATETRPAGKTRGTYWLIYQEQAKIFCQ